MSEKKDLSYYDILEIDHSSSQRDITRAYLRLKAAYGKDSLASYTGIEEGDRSVTLTKIEEAYLVLSRINKRQEYDEAHNFVSDGTPPRPFEPKVNAIIGDKILVTRQFAEPLASKFNVVPNMEEEIASQTVFTGPFLKRVREYRNISIEEVSEYTKISRNYFGMIEGERFSEFPALVYMRGFLSQYAKYLKLDPVKVCQSYLENMNSQKEKQYDN